MTTPNWFTVIYKYLVEKKLPDAIIDKIMGKIMEKFGLKWDSDPAKLVATNLGTAVTGTSIPALMVNSTVLYLKLMLLCGNMPACYNKTGIQKHGTIWAGDARNPYDPNKDVDKYLEVLFFSWAYSYAQSDFTYHEPLYKY